MSDLQQQLRELGRVFETLARALELEEERSREDPRRVAAVARAVVDPAFRRRLFGDPARVLGRQDDGLERLARTVRDLDAALARIEDDADFDTRELA